MRLGGVSNSVEFFRRYVTELWASMEPYGILVFIDMIVQHWYIEYEGVAVGGGGMACGRVV